MGLLDLLKKKKVIEKENKVESTFNYTTTEQPSTYIRKIKVAGVSFKNEDGTSRQKILDNIAKKKAPFDKRLDISIDEYEWEGKPAYYVKVNGQTVGSVEQSMASFITSNKSRIKGISDFWVSGGDHIDGEYFPYYARMKITVESKKK